MMMSDMLLPLSQPHTALPDLDRRLDRIRLRRVPEVNLDPDPDRAPVHGPISCHLIHSVQALAMARLPGLAAMQLVPAHMNVEDLVTEIAIKIRAISPVDGTQLISGAVISISIPACIVYIMSIL